MGGGEWYNWYRWIGSVLVAGFSRVHDPVVWTGGYFPGLNPSCLRRRECIMTRDNKFGGRVREVVSSSTDVRHYLMEDGA